MALRPHLIMKTDFFSIIMYWTWNPLATRSHQLLQPLACQEKWKRCGASTKKSSAEELEGGVYLWLVHDIFFILRLLSSTAVNMMDNVLGLGLLGVICCLYHQLWRAETEREGANERNWQRAADGEQNQSSLQPNPAGGWPNWGDLKFKV